MKILPAFVLLLASLASYSQDIGGLTAVYEDKRAVVKLKWNHSDDRVTAYRLQRSADKSFWSDISAFNMLPALKNRFFSYTDEKPTAGKNFYRLKAFINNNTVAYSSTIMVIIGKPGKSWIMYPVPVGDILNLQYNGSDIITGVIGITIQNIATRQVFQKLRMASVNRFIQIPVSNLGRGLYLVTISVGNDIVWNQQFSK
jgi:hypothetical protein